MSTGASFDMLCMQHHNSDPQVAYFVWSVITIFTNYESTATPCGAAYNIWAFCECLLYLLPTLHTIPTYGLMSVLPIDCTFMCYN